MNNDKNSEKDRIVASVMCNHKMIISGFVHTCYLFAIKQKSLLQAEYL